MKASRNPTLFVLVALAVAAVAGLVLTGRAPHPALGGSSGAVSASRNIGSGQHAPDNAPGVAMDRAGIEIDQQHLAAARSLAALAATPEEQRLAADAVRAADAEVDLAFASALRTAAVEPAVSTPQTTEIERRIARLQTEIQADQSKLQQFTAAVKTAKEPQQETLQSEIAVLEAELDLNRDSLADAQQDLIRAGGDPRSRVQELLNQHEALEHANGSVQLAVGSGPSAPSVFAPTSLIGRWSAWSALRGKRAQLEAARMDAQAAARGRAGEHQLFEERLEQARPLNKTPTPPATIALPPARPGGKQINPNQPNAAAVFSLQTLAIYEQDLADLDKRIQDLGELGSAYSQWIALVAAAERVALRGILWAALWIILALLVLTAFHRSLDRLLERLALERKQRSTLRALARFSAQVVAAVVILFVIFGMPNQFSTVVGLATAGLTVALKDFIVSFLGWFVLMGHHGIRVGDSVEINGVRGDVVEIGLLRTILLETGNWTDAGQPTGRQVAFLNSFAVEGYYFNFTTSGQWLWDELQALVPSGQDPYALVEKIRGLVAAETHGNADRAEEEWARATRRYGARAFSAEPSVNIRTTDRGVQVMVRYITRAAERAAVGSRLNHAVVELLHGSKSPQPESVR